MAFGQSSGPSASHRQIAQLVELLQQAGHTDFRDARGPMGFTQRQAGGKFTIDEAEAFIAELEEQLAEPDPSLAAAGKHEPNTPPVVRRTAAERALDKFSDHELATALQSRGWVVMEP